MLLVLIKIEEKGKTATYLLTLDVYMASLEQCYDMENKSNKNTGEILLTANKQPEIPAFLRLKEKNQTLREPSTASAV